MVEAAGDSMRFWQVTTTGLDQFNMDALKERNIPVSNTPGPFSAVALAECAMMHILMLTRKYHQAQENLQAGNMFWPARFELVGLNLRIIGFGASGTLLALRANAFGLQVSAIDIRDVSEEKA